MVLRLFLVLMLANILVAVSKANASDFLQLDNSSMAGMVSANAVADRTGRKDCVRRLVSMLSSYFLNRAVAVHHLRLQDQHQGELADDSALPGLVAGSDRSGFELLLTGEYAIDVRRKGAILHWRKEF